METLAEGGPSGPSPIARLASPPLFPFCFTYLLCWGAPLSSLVMQEIWAVKIYATFWGMFSAAAPSDLRSLRELGEGRCLSGGGAWRWGRFGGAAGRGLRWGSGYLSSGQLGWACGLWVVSLCSPFAGFCWICCAGVAAVIFGLPQVG